MAVTITEIAERVGVSPGTVSRVLNGRYKENRPAIARRAQSIREVAAEMGYRPNVSARSMQTGRFGTMAFVTCGDLGFDWFAPGLLHGIHRELESHGQRLVLNELSASQLASSRSVPWLFSEAAVDAVLLHLDPKIPNALAQFRRSHPNRVVLINDKLDRDCVHPDEIGGGELAGSYLLSKGHTRIGYFSLAGIEGGHFSVADRWHGLSARLRSAGAEAIMRPAGAPGFDSLRGNGIDCANALLDANPDMTAVVCYTLMEATALDSAARSRGMRIPDDLSILVFNERPAHAVTGVAVDTLIVPFASLGSSAVSMAIDLIESDAGSLPGRRVPYAEFFDSSIARVVSVSTGEFS